MDNLIAIANQFNSNGPVLNVHAYGTGNVNDTYLVTLDAGATQNLFILQRINTHVFRKPELIMVNMCALSDHVQVRLERENKEHASFRRWELPRVYTTRSGHNHFIDDDQGFWRAMSFVERSTAFARIQNTSHAAEAGYALGRFHSLISDMHVCQLHDTLVGFHVTPGYLCHYDQVLASNHHCQVNPDVRECIDFVEQHRAIAPVLENAKDKGILPIRPMHGDPKVDNIMIDDESHQAVSIIDLDTVKPGLVHYDIGDCLRSCCNLLGEETEDLNGVRFDLDLCRAILAGYLSVAGSFFNEHDYAYLYDSIRLITFELGLRFLTDHLEGNVYFKVRESEHNLRRAKVQFRLLRSIEAQANQLCMIIADQHLTVWTSLPNNPGTAGEKQRLS